MILPIAQFDLTGAAESAGFILALLIELGMIVWFARGLKDDLKRLASMVAANKESAEKADADLRERINEKTAESNARIAKLEQHREEMNSRLGEIESKVGTAVAILERLEKRMG